ncbi:MAG: YjgN family protein [Exilispira sp.]|jgi:uncharacterized membrane protein YjgN (DUF898 family)|nr:YjgN family protein [Exilispira sp.]
MEQNIQNNNQRIEFTGKGGSLFWLTIWTGFLTLITFGFYLPWAICQRARWEARNTFINGKQMKFTGKGSQIAGIVYISILLSILTLGIFSYWAYCTVRKWKFLNYEVSNETNPQKTIDLF